MLTVYEIVVGNVMKTLFFWAVFPLAFIAVFYLIGNTVSDDEKTVKEQLIYSACVNNAAGRITLLSTMLNDEETGLGLADQFTTLATEEKNKTCECQANFHGFLSDNAARLYVSFLNSNAEFTQVMAGRMERSDRKYESPVFYLEQMSKPEQDILGQMFQICGD